MAGKISLIISAVLLGAVIYLFTQVGTPAKETVVQNNSPMDTTQVAGPLKIAFVNIDSLLLNYQYAQELNDEMIMEESLAKGKITRKMDNLQQQAEAFQKGVMDGTDLSVTSEEQFNNKMMSFQVQAEDYQNTQMRKLEEMTLTMNDTLLSIFDDYIAGLVQQTHYDFIFKDGIGGSLFHKNKAFDLTEKMISDLNTTYETESNESAE